MTNFVPWKTAVSIVPPPAPKQPRPVFNCRPKFLNIPPRLLPSFPRPAAACPCFCVGVCCGKFHPPPDTITSTTHRQERTRGHQLYQVANCEQTGNYLETQVHTKVRNHGEGPYKGLLLVESGYTAFTFKTLLRHYAKRALTHGLST